jgi:hypothetical protein
MLESKPSQPVVFPPTGGTRYRVSTGDSWDSIARANGLDTWVLIEFNFPVVRNAPDFQTKCRQVNWLLHDRVGCTRSADGMNYRFDSADTPGVIFIPPPTVAFTHRVRLHFRSLSLTAVGFDTILRGAEKVYAQYGIRIDFASGLSLGLPEDQARRLETVDGTCKWDITSGEYNEVQTLSGGIPRSEILVCYISRFSTGNTGCGGHAVSQPACIVASAGSQWTTAHEVGHVLLGSGFRPVHETSRSNLMYPTINLGSATPVLTDAQVAQMMRSPCCRPI